MNVDKCPECGREMEAGRLFANQWLSWNPDPEVKEVWQVRKAGFEPLQTIFKMKVQGHLGARCKDCRIVVFQYPER